MDTLNHIFNEAEIQSIKRTPISSLGLFDRLIWIASKNGQYTVKSGYRIAMLYEKKVKEDEETSVRKGDEERLLWRGI